MKVRWVMRLFGLVVLAVVVKMVWAPEPQAFIAWPEKQDVTERLQWEVKKWQRQFQDFPGSLEVEVRRLFQEFQPNGNGREV